MILRADACVCHAESRLPLCPARPGGPASCPHAPLPLRGRSRLPDRPAPDRRARPHAGPAATRQACRHQHRQPAFARRPDIWRQLPLARRSPKSAAASIFCVETYNFEYRRHRRAVTHDRLVHDPEKCEAVFRKDHAQSKSQSAMTIHPHLIALWWDELIPVQCPRP